MEKLPFAQRSAQPSLQALDSFGLTLITRAEQPAFENVYQHILQDAKEYNFYYPHLQVWCYHPEFLSVYVYASHRGWALVFEGNDPNAGPFVELKFIFVYPEYRRQGFLRSVHEQMLKTGKQISTTTEEHGMVHALHALGYTLNGKTVDKRELRFIYTKHLP